MKQKELDLFYSEIREIRDIEIIKKEVLRRYKGSSNLEIVDEVSRLKIKSLKFEHEGVLYAIPAKNSDKLLNDIRKNNINTLGYKMLKKSNVPLIPYRSRSHIFNIINDKNYLHEYKKMYTMEYMLCQYYTVYKDIKEFNKFNELILEAIECFILGKYAASITLMISIIEGISRKYCDNEGVSYNKKGSQSSFKALIKSRRDFYIENILLYDFNSNRNYMIPTEFKFYKDTNRINKLLLYNNEMLDLLDSFYKFGVEYFYKSDSDNDLNRHSILHGINIKYCTELNFYRIFSCLECLSLAITLEPLGNIYGVESKFHEDFYHKLDNLYCLDLTKNIIKNKSNKNINKF